MPTAREEALERLKQQLRTDVGNMIEDVQGTGDTEAEAEYRREKVLLESRLSSIETVGDIMKLMCDMSYTLHNACYTVIECLTPDCRHDELRNMPTKGWST